MLKKQDLLIQRNIFSDKLWEFIIKCPFIDSPDLGFPSVIINMAAISGLPRWAYAVQHIT